MEVQEEAEEEEEEEEEERAAGATDTRRNHRRSAKAGTGNQGCLGNLALSIKCGRLRAHIRVPMEMVMRRVSEEEEGRR